MPTNGWISKMTDDLDDDCDSQKFRDPTDAERVRLYEWVFHNLHLFRWTFQEPKIIETLEKISRWSGSTYHGNGEVDNDAWERNVFWDWWKETFDTLPADVEVTK